MVRRGRAGVILPRRLRAAADMVEKGSVVCDVGCDHGFVPIYLVENGISKRAIATDVNRGPLRAAEEHIRERALEHYIETRQSDGLAALKKGEADTLICAGMGGLLMRRILEEGEETARSMKALILLPQSGIMELREYLRNGGYLIAGENMILEDGKYYTIIKAVPMPEKAPGMESESGASPQNRRTKQDKEAAAAALERRRRVEDRYGPLLLAKRHPVLLRFLKKEYAIYDGIRKQLPRQENASGDAQANGRFCRQEKRRNEIEERLDDIRYALSFYDALEQTKEEMP